MPEDMMVQRSLLCRPALLPDESWWSYLHRLAAANGYEPFSLLTKVYTLRLAELGVRDNLMRPKRAETFVVLATLTRLTPHELALVSEHAFAQAPIWAYPMETVNLDFGDGMSLPLLSSLLRYRHILSPDAAQFCPTCLREAAYHRRAWMLADVSACLRHQRLLHNGCPHCQTWVNVANIVRCQCGKCGANLTDVVREKLLTAQGLSAQRILRAWWGLEAPTAESDPVPLLAQPPHVLYSLFKMLFHALEPRVSKHTPPAERYRGHTAAVSALTDWPRGFCAFLRARLEDDVRGYSYRHGYDFRNSVYLDRQAALNFWLTVFQDHPQLKFVQTTVERFLEENNVQVCSNSWRTRVRVTADEELQKISRQVINKIYKQNAKLLESL
jgi:hypothetical protein